MKNEHFLKYNLKRLRKHHGYTQKEVADILELKSSSSYGDLERGLTEPSISYLVILSETYNVPITDLIGTDFGKIDLSDYFESIKRKKEGENDPKNVSLNVSPNVSLNQKSEKNSGEVTQIQEGNKISSVGEEYATYKKVVQSEKIIAELNFTTSLLNEKIAEIEQLKTTINNLNLLIQKLSQ